MFDYLANQCPLRRRAWDCATGNGQAAVGLATHFDEVIATDASAEQIESAMPHSRVSYRVAPAEASQIEAASIDLITVGQALHWFDIARFVAEVERVIVPGGIVAAWCYELCQVSSDVDAVVDHLYVGLLDDFWPPERAIVEDRYRTIDLPGLELTPPDFDMALGWQVDDMLGYLRSWSASKRYESRHGDDPVTIIEAPLRAAWGDGKRRVTWPLSVRVCRQ